MSAIFGFVHLDGRPASRENLEAMAAALDHWGPDGVHIGCHGAAALGHALLTVTPESPYETMPFHDPDSDVFLTAAARLDNRDELLAHFSIPSAEHPVFPDGRLVFLSYQKWGEDSPKHLFGDWSFVAWHDRDRRLFLARDQLGNTGLYYHYRPPLFAFTSHPDGIFALPGIERCINEKHIASYLTFIPLGEKEDTCWMDIHTLLSGCAMTVTPRRIETRIHWEITEQSPVVRLRDEDYLEGFLHHYRAAVKTRLRSTRPIGATLSAGLDSGSVTALAAQALKQEGRTLTAFTSVPLYKADHLVPGALADEWPLARTISREYDNIDHQPIDAANVSPIQGIERAVAIMRAPQHAATNEFWIMALHDAAREQGIGVMLTGQLGNGGVSWSGGKNRILCLFAEGKWDEGVKAMAQWKNRTGRSWIRTIAGRVAKPLLWPHLQRFQGLLSGFTPDWIHHGTIHPDFAARMDLQQAARKREQTKPFIQAIKPFEERRLTLLRNGMMVGPVWHATGTAFGMEVRDPTADIGLLEFCLTVPVEQDTFNGGQRMLIRRSMADIMPGKARWNTVRGKQAADAALRVLHHRSEMEIILARLNEHPETSRYLDIPMLQQVWRDLQIKVSPQTAQRTATILLRGIMCGCFIEAAAS